MSECKGGDLGQEILAVALEQGWQCRDSEDNRDGIQGFGGRLGLIQFWSGGLGDQGGYYHPALVQVVTDHSFAKSFFGSRWRDELTAFVLSDDRVEFIKAAVERIDETALLTPEGSS